MNYGIREHNCRECGIELSSEHYYHFCLCIKCDKKRIEHIDKQFDKLMKGFKEAK